MKLRHTALLCLAGIFITASASATTFFIDELQITKNGISDWFLDPFDDGNVPPSSESAYPDGQQASYLTLPNPLVGPEQNGRVEMDTADGVLTTSYSTGVPLLFQRARVATNTSVDPNNSSGLKQDHTFEVRGLFDLTEPTFNQEFYGIRLTDYGVPTPNDIAYLRVVKNTVGAWQVQFAEITGVGGLNLIDNFLLTGVALLDQYEQIALMLTKSDEASSLITASFELIDTDLSLPNLLFDMGGSSQIFDGERWTRAGFFAGRVVPVPAPLLLIGFGMLGIIYRRRK